MRKLRITAFLGAAALACAIAAIPARAQPAAPKPPAVPAPAEPAAPKPPAAAKAQAPKTPAAAKADSAAADSAKAKDPAEEFMKRYGKEAADSLESRLRSDYALCTGEDAARVSRAALFRWKTQVDSMVMDLGYAEKFRSFVSTTGIKAHDVRPCEPLVFYDRLNRQIHEMDSIISAQRAAKEKAHKDSMAVLHEQKALKSNPADILGIPAGMSRTTVQTILDRNKIKTTSAPRHLQADRVMFDSLIVTIAFYFDEDDKYNGYEVETEAMQANRLDGTVRRWADQLSRAYEKRLGPPSDTHRIGFSDIKQGRLSIVTKWEKGPSRPRVIVGLATHNYFYYAKVMVSY